VTTRAEFMGRLRAELGKTSGLFPATVAERPVAPAALADTIRRELAERWPQTLDRFREEFERVGGVFYRVPALGGVADVVSRIAHERDARRVVTWHPSALGIDIAPSLRASGLEVTAMPRAGETEAARQQVRDVVAAAELGVTGVDLAVAETGTLVLVSGGGRPRSTSLLPAYHVAVFDRSALVETLAQVGVFLEAWHGDGRAPGDGGAVNFITGPSRTADIELTLTRGVHGPREVHAIFVEAPPGG
jgi:L-lactate dehydrogenase complex protein LldG